MKRREFVTLLGGAAAWPLAARAQQGERMRRVGIVTSVLETDADAQARYAVLRQALQQLGWTEERNIKFDQRFGSAGDSDVVRRHAQELVALAPDLIVASGSQNVAALQQVSRTVPIVCLGIVDPVGAGFVASLQPAIAEQSRFMRTRPSKPDHLPQFPPSSAMSLPDSASFQKSATQPQRDLGGTNSPNV
jgi:putative tryptophan/tyrosine transport system substrate-binding protein